MEKSEINAEKVPKKDPWSLNLFEESSMKFDRIQSEHKKPKAPINNTGLLITDKGKIHVIQPAGATSEVFNNAHRAPKVKRSLSQPHVTSKESHSLFALRKRSDSRLMDYRFHPDESASYYYMYCLVWACGIMIFWKHMWLLPILPIPISIFVIKHLGFYLGLWSWIHGKLSSVFNALQRWCGERYDALVPVPIRGTLQYVRRLDDYVKKNLKDSIDAVASSVVIIGLIVFVTCASIFVLVQVYAEAIMLVQMTSNVINQTVVHNPELQQLLPPTFEDTVDSILDNAYQYGREGISKAVSFLQVVLIID